jgi:dUTP pyrophosphatase
VTRLAVLRLDHAEGLPLPSYQTAYSAGLDLSAAIPAEAPLTLPPGGRAAVPTGFVFAVPDCFEGQVRARSGRALREGLAVLNAPGTLDADFRGELKVLLVNLGAAPIVIARGDRIAQLVIAPVSRVALAEVAELGTTDRGEGGFGSTGR